MLALDAFILSNLCQTLMKIEAYCFDLHFSKGFKFLSMFIGHLLSFYHESRIYLFCLFILCFLKNLLFGLLGIFTF